MRNWYRWYVLALLICIYMMSQIDRQILTITAPLIRSDLGLTDAQLGLLYGTSFALFYGVFGVPLSKLADAWHRVHTLWTGLLFWSIAIALGGLSTNFAQLSASRVGLGFGQASSTPAAASILGDYFERERRATIMSLYNMGGYLGMGASMLLGGVIIAEWLKRYPVSSAAPFGLSAWQATFLFLGVPGILLSLVIAITIREPVRGRLDGVTEEVAQRPFRDVALEIASMIPLLNLLELGRRGGRSAMAINLASAAVCAAAVVGIIEFTEGLMPHQRHAFLFQLFGLGITSNMLQWVVLGLTVYAIWGWIQFIRLKDRTVYQLTIAGPTFRYLVLASGLYGFCSTSVYAFNYLYAVRYLGFGPKDGVFLGITTALASLAGLALGGFLGDFAKSRHPLGRLHVIGASIGLTGLLGIIQYKTGSELVFYLMLAMTSMCLSSWTGCIQATLMDIVLPRMRGVAMSLTILAAAVMGLASGPYTVGFVSDITGDLRFALLLSFTSLPAAGLFVFLAARRLRNDEHSVHERAKQSDEALQPEAMLRLGIGE